MSKEILSRFFLCQTKEKKRIRLV